MNSEPERVEMENNKETLLFSKETADELLEQQWENNPKGNQLERIMSHLREIKAIVKENNRSQETLLRYFFTNSNAPIPPKKKKSLLVKPLKMIIDFIKRV